MAQIIRSSSDLSERIRAIENRTRHSGSGDPHQKVRTGWHGIDQLLGGLSRHGVHEWISMPPGDATPTDPRQTAPEVFPPLTILTHLAWSAIGAVPPASQEQTNHALDPADSSCAEAGAVFWIGRRCWPSARALLRQSPGKAATENHLLRQRSIFVDPPSMSDRLWAIDLCLRSPAVSAVIADGTGFDMAATRRLQLAAASADALALLTRPPRELKSLSAAMTRWRVQPVVSPPGFAEACENDLDLTELDQPPEATVSKSFLSSVTTSHTSHWQRWLRRIFPKELSRGLSGELSGGHSGGHSGRLPGAGLPKARWMLELLRCKGVQPDSNTHGATTKWVLEWDCETGLVVVPAELGDRSGAAPNESSIDEDSYRATLALAARFGLRRSIA